ncbi:MAG: peptide deformylase [Gammaproteobacteria bacterium]|jgi:peptide deformylase|nr:peptide deformylase [Gammaproteobacteria bacterium]MDP6617532.1 peptide deformylase [Gammaproteobacteria bacterium]MDP6694409.1 peptide deformylase [Gammaproteobacteria bacterium]MDP7041955.1 peptide deformylase [Gammaproteobacteria bacterium]
MALLEILEYPDKRLRTIAAPVTDITDDLQRLIDDMFETMYSAPGIGLAATQVDVHQRLLVMDVSEDQDQPLIFINPEILAAEGTLSGDEGCLSVPEVYEEVERAERVRVKALDRHGKEFELEAEGLLAVCIQHETDHLNGKLFVDYLSELKRQRLKKKASKARKRAGDQPVARRTPAI